MVRHSKTRQIRVQEYSKEKSHHSYSEISTPCCDGSLILVLCAGATHSANFLHMASVVSQSMEGSRVQVMMLWCIWGVAVEPLFDEFLVSIGLSSGSRQEVEVREA